MSENESSIHDAPVNVTDWVACYNTNDDQVVCSCTVTAESGESISAVGLILNQPDGQVLVSCYTASSNGNTTVSPAINIARSGLNIGDSVLVAVQGLCAGEHFLIEQDLTISKC